MSSPQHVVWNFYPAPSRRLVPPLPISHSPSIEEPPPPAPYLASLAVLSCLLLCGYFHQPLNPSPRPSEPADCYPVRCIFTGPPPTPPMIHPPPLPVSPLLSHYASFLVPGSILFPPLWILLPLLPDEELYPPFAEPLEPIFPAGYFVRFWKIPSDPLLSLSIYSPVCLAVSL